jgi:hypothetical protein
MAGATQESPLRVRRNDEVEAHSRSERGPAKAGDFLRSHQGLAAGGGDDDFRPAAFSPNEAR